MKSADVLLYFFDDDDVLVGIILLINPETLEDAVALDRTDLLSSSKSLAKLLVDSALPGAVLFFRNMALISSL